MTSEELRWVLETVEEAILDSTGDLTLAARVAALTEAASEPLVDARAA